MSVGYMVGEHEAQIWAATYSLTFPVLYDESGEQVVPLFMPFWGIFIFPHTCIVDDQQTLQYTHAGYFYPQTIIEIDSIIQELMIPELGASVDDIDFGEVEVGESVSEIIYLDNVRTGILNVDTVYVSGAPYSVQFTPGEIYAVDDSMEVTVTFSPETGGTFDDTLHIESDGGDLHIPLTGVGLGGGVNDKPNESPSNFVILNNYPNPFNAYTTISYQLTANRYVELVVYDVMGGEVQTLVSGRQSVGQHKMMFDGSGLESGVYFARLVTGGEKTVCKMLLVK